MRRRDEQEFAEFATAARASAAPDGVPDLRRLGAGLRHRAGGADPGVRRLAADRAQGRAARLRPAVRRQRGDRHRAPAVQHRAAGDARDHGPGQQVPRTSASRPARHCSTRCASCRHGSGPAWCCGTSRTSRSGRPRRCSAATRAPSRARPRAPWTPFAPRPTSRISSTRGHSHEPPEHPAARGQHRRPARPPRRGRPWSAPAGRGYAADALWPGSRSPRWPGSRSVSRWCAPDGDSGDQSPAAQPGGAHPRRTRCRPSRGATTRCWGRSRRTPPTRRWTVTSSAACSPTARSSLQRYPDGWDRAQPDRPARRGDTRRRGGPEGPSATTSGRRRARRSSAATPRGLWLLDSAGLGWTHVLEAVDFDVNMQRAAVDRRSRGHIFLTAGLGTPEETSPADLPRGPRGWRDRARPRRGRRGVRRPGGLDRRLRRPGARADHPEPGRRRALVRSRHRRLCREGPRAHRQTGSC